MNSLFCNIFANLQSFFSNLTSAQSTDFLFLLIIAIVVEGALAVFFLLRAIFSYEARLNRGLDKINLWLYENKVITENNIKDFNELLKSKAPKRLCYFWQQYILFRENAPSTYLSAENLIDKPLKSSSYNTNIKNLTIFSCLWALACAMFSLMAVGPDGQLTGGILVLAIMLPVIVLLICAAFVAFLSIRKTAILNSLYQNTAMFGRFMDNACLGLPGYIDYQILFTPKEIENGQPVLREFLDFKARKEKEEFNRAKLDEEQTEQYDFASTGVDGSLILDRAMKETELYLKKKDKLLVKISQIEGELDSRRKNFDNIQKEYQTKIQASKENIDKLRQMQEETTNRIESNYYRKQQTQEIGKQEQFEQEFEQQRAKYMLEKNEGEEEIAKLNKDLAQGKENVEVAMLSEYQSFFNKFCGSAEKVVTQVFKSKLEALQIQLDREKNYITELEIKLKDMPKGVLDGQEEQQQAPEEDITEGKYDVNGNYVYPNGTFYDPEGNFHDEKGNVFSKEGTLILSAAEKEANEKRVVNFDDFDPYIFLTDTTQLGDVFGVAENVVDNVDENNLVTVVNNVPKNDILAGRDKNSAQAEELSEAEPSTKQPQPEQAADAQHAGQESAQNAQPLPEQWTEQQADQRAEAAQAAEPAEPEFTELENFVLDDDKPKIKPNAANAGSGAAASERTAVPSKKAENAPAKETSGARRGRPRKTPAEDVPQKPKGKVGRPKKIVKQDEETQPKQKRGRGRPKKSTIDEINKKLSAEEQRIKEIRNELDADLKTAVDGIDAKPNDKNQAQRDKYISEIDRLQKEAKSVMNKPNSEKELAEINAKLERLLMELKKIN